MVAHRFCTALRVLAFSCTFLGAEKIRYHWLPDGYGDYVRHYLQAMAAAPELAPDNQNHLAQRKGEDHDPDS